MTLSNLKHSQFSYMEDILIRKNQWFFTQFACSAGCVQIFTLTQKCKIRISEFWPKLTFLLKKQTKFVVTFNIDRFVPTTSLHAFRKHTNCIQFEMEHGQLGLL